MFLESTSYSTTSSDTFYTQKRIQEQMEKDLAAVARMLRANKACEDLCWSMAQEFKKINSKLNTERFMKAASITYDLSK